MRYLKETHNYVSLKMKHKLKLDQEFPALGRKGPADDGFSHMVEQGDPEEQILIAEEAVTVKKDSTEATIISEIVESNQNLQVAAENILKVNPNDFTYDAENDTMKPIDINAFDQLIEKHPAVNKLKRDSKRQVKINDLKKKVLDKLKVEEVRKRDISCDSIKSDCSAWGDGQSDTETRGETRGRSDDDDSERTSKKKARQSRNLLKPPKIVLSKQ